MTSTHFLPVTSSPNRDQDFLVTEQYEAQAVEARIIRTNPVEERPPELVQRDIIVVSGNSALFILYDLPHEY